MRKLSITMFAVIGLLLGSKVGLHIWQLPSTDPLIASNQSVSEIVAPVATAQPTMLTTAPSMPSKTDSLAIIESYLIPSANAETTSASGQYHSIIEDKTLTNLRQLKKDMDQRTKTLNQREQSLQQAEEKLKQRITELEQLEASIQQRLADESKIKSKKIKRLTAVYEGMKPERSAPVISRMELSTVVKIFLLMDEKKVGKILSFLSPEKAVTISQALTKQISSIK